MNGDAARVIARDYVNAVTATMSRVDASCLDDVVEAASLCATSLRAGGTLLICGNGGSAADAQHLATEFVSTLTLDNRRPSIPAIALTTDSSLITAIGNDFGFDAVFARQVESLGRTGDVLVGISTSGNSINVVRAAEQAREQGLVVVGLSGEAGGKLASLADVAIKAPSAVTAQIQECHLALEHLLALLVERDLYPIA
jgi:D-sedoheptulose 7-phosphate isomerase